MRTINGTISLLSILAFRNKRILSLSKNIWNSRGMFSHKMRQLKTSGSIHSFNGIFFSDDSHQSAPHPDANARSAAKLWRMRTRAAMSLGEERDSNESIEVIISLTWRIVESIEFRNWSFRIRYTQLYFQKTLVKPPKITFTLLYLQVKTDLWTFHFHSI